MEGFFKALSEFLESPLAKSYGWVILISYIICVVISWSVMSFIFIKIIVPAKTVKADRILRSCERIIRENKDLKDQVAALRARLYNKINYQFEEEDKKDFEDKALDKFVRRKKK